MLPFKIECLLGAFFECEVKLETSKVILEI